MDSPLQGLSVLDFTTLLPGPLATLFLAEGGAEVVKVEPPGGDPIRRVGPFTAAGTSIRFMLLNAGKSSVILDLKSEDGLARAREMAHDADVLVEQFRPGVMARLGLGYAELTQANPGLIYCSITGYGQTGPKAQLAGHDLNYAAGSGLLSLVLGPDGAPQLPPATFADIAGGSYPAVINILLALAGRARHGRGAHLDVAMAENLAPFMYWAIAGGQAGRWPTPNGELLTGASPRYGIYPCREGHVAVAALEQQFWTALCAAIDLPESLRDDRGDPAATRAGVAARFATATADEWQRRLAGLDVCVGVVADLEHAVVDPQLLARGIYDREVGVDGEDETVPAMHVPIDPRLRGSERRRDAPGPPEAAASLARPGHGL